MSCCFHGGGLSGGRPPEGLERLCNATAVQQLSPMPYRVLLEDGDFVEVEVEEKASRMEIWAVV